MSMAPVVHEAASEALKSPIPAEAGKLEISLNVVVDSILPNRLPSLYKTVLVIMTFIKKISAMSKSLKLVQALFIDATFDRPIGDGAIGFLPAWMSNVGVKPNQGYQYLNSFPAMTTSRVHSQN
jgi:hypothetical protein